MIPGPLSSIRSAGSRVKIVAVAVVALVAVLGVGGLLVLGPLGSSAESPTTTGASAEQSGGAFQSLTSATVGPSEEVSGSPQFLEGEPFRTCEVCHADFLEMPPQTPDHDLIFSHEVHLSLGQACDTCHRPPLGHFDAPAPMMMSCLSCHEGETAPHQCVNCHRKIDEIAPGYDEPVVHLDPDVLERRTCEKCHDVQVWCEQCHGVVMPHPAGWEVSHTGFAFSHADTCEKCHQSRDVTFCVRCHGVEMPHPPFWYSNHGDIAGDNPSSCVSCHPRSPQFCNSCHHAGYSPTAAWTSDEHGPIVEQRGTGACFVCHEQVSCEECHDPGRFPKI